MKLFQIVFLLLINLATAQSISSDWTPINSDEESVIYLNSSKIIGYGNEISVWAFEKFKVPIELDKNEKVSRIKTHYLFNKMKKRYAEIGVIYYDNKGQIINRSSKSNFQGTSAAFMTPIKIDPKVEIIYKEVISFLITGNIKPIDETSTNKSNTKVEYSTNMDIPVSTHQLAEKEKDEVKPASKDVSLSTGNAPSHTLSVGLAAIKVSEKSVDTVDPTKEDSIDIQKIDEKLKIEEKPTIVAVESTSEIKAHNINETINIQELPQNEYDSTIEKALKNAIFTDGSLYCFQVSSWKTKAYADRELNKLISEGYSAFLVSVKPKHKRSIWHRVRVGYFNSLQETQKVQRLVGKR